ncbi:MAG: winged helix DNA-binding domain-containing protein, partial [Nitrosotalea sp.]
SIQHTLDKGEVLRTHLLRPTWHLVAAKDICWMLELTAPHIRTRMKFRQRFLNLTDAILQKCNVIIESALLKDQFLTRDDLIKALNHSGISTAKDNRSAHIFLYAELDGLICSGPKMNGKPTYALLRNRAPKPPTVNRKEALALLAIRYFSSHGPATLGDFVWWSGLPVSDARAGIKMAGESLTCGNIQSKNYWYSQKYIKDKRDEFSVHLLPAYDEFVISYTDRSDLLTTAHHNKAISNNGIFKPLIIIHGEATGIWKRTIKKDNVIIETEFFRPHTKAEHNGIAEAADRYGKFLNKKMEMK